MSQICVLDAIRNLIEHNNKTLPETKAKSSNKINIVGDDFEDYVKNLFVQQFLSTDQDKDQEVYDKFFSFPGEKNHPPDLIIRNSDAIEIKKIEHNHAGCQSSLELNSSPPRAKLLADDPKISDNARNCEGDGAWKEKNNLYILGCVNKNSKKELFYINFFYGDCVVPDPVHYQQLNDDLQQEISNVLEKSSKNGVGIMDSKTNELGRLNNIDHCGTNLRVRGVYMLQNPFITLMHGINNELFEVNNLYDKYSTVMKEHEKSDNEFKLAEKSRKELISLEELRSRKKEFQQGLHFVCKKEMYDKFPYDKRTYMENMIENYPSLKIKDIKIKDPNNPQSFLDAKYIQYKFEVK